MKSTIFVALCTTSLFACSINGNHNYMASWQYNPAKEGQPTLTLSKDNKLTGFTGCNRIFGSYKVESDNISFEGIGVTKMSCHEKQDIEALFIEAINNSDKLEVQNDKLILLNKDTVLLEMVRTK